MGIICLLNAAFAGVLWWRIGFIILYALQIVVIPEMYILHDQQNNLYHIRLQKPYFIYVGCEGSVFLKSTCLHCYQEHIHKQNHSLHLFASITHNRPIPRSIILHTLSLLHCIVI